MLNPVLSDYSSNKFVIGNLIYDSMMQCISSDKETVYLRQKLNEVLYHIVTNQSRVVSREKLIKEVWNGNFYTGEKAVTHSVCKLRKIFENLGEKNVNIKTLPKRGYFLQAS